MKTESLSEKIILFSGFLKNHGFKIFSSNIMEALQGLKEIDLLNREDFFSVLRANLVTTDVEWKLFEELFEEFWKEIDQGKKEGKGENSREEEACKADSASEPSPDLALDQGTTQEESCEEDKSVREATYSPVASLERRNLAKFQKRDIQVAQLILKNMISFFRIAATRRFKRSKKRAAMDFRRVFKKSLKAGGIPLELFYKKKKKRLKRLVILTDVSGSMDRYARFVMPFIMGLKGVGARADVFVFSTSLTVITPLLKRFGIDEALERISLEVPDWAGGTRIGYSLHQFNEQHGERLLNKRTVVVIMSDGWDLGGRELLRREMETLSKKANCVIWLNPLAGDTEYEPVCQGMRTALPYLDHFLPADSLQSLKRVGRTLSRLMAH